jgi:FlaA1/EpsC-like NDP-sugar epimerase
MTIPEAARLVLQAAAIGESGQVLVLDMGEPVRIVDLARDLIRLAGFVPGDADGQIQVVFTGLRAGEKLYEELLADLDVTLATSVPRLRVARIASPDGRIGALLQWTLEVVEPDEQALRSNLARAIDCEWDESSARGAAK